LPLYQQVIVDTYANDLFSGQKWHSQDLGHHSSVGFRGRGSKVSEPILRTFLASWLQHHHLTIFLAQQITLIKIKELLIAELAMAKCSL